MKNKLYLISQEENVGYDTYDSAVVVAPDEETAKIIDPRNWGRDNIFMTEEDWNRPYSSWCSSPDKVKVLHLGEATDDLKVGVVTSSFNAG
jgi:hypothetical protein